MLICWFTGYLMTTDLTVEIETPCKDEYECWRVKDLESENHVLFEGTILEFTWTSWGKSQKSESGYPMALLGCGSDNHE
jgi:hypothetical protein